MSLEFSLPSNISRLKCPCCQILRNSETLNPAGRVSAAILYLEQNLNTKTIDQAAALSPGGGCQAVDFVRTLGLLNLSVAKLFDRILRQNTHHERTARQGPLAASFSSASYYPENLQSTTISWTPLAPFLLVNVVIMPDSLTVSSPLAGTNSKRNKALIVRNCHRSQ